MSNLVFISSLPCIQTKRPLLGTILSQTPNSFTCSVLERFKTNSDSINQRSKSMFAKCMKRLTPHLIARWRTLFTLSYAPATNRLRREGLHWWESLWIKKFIIHRCWLRLYIAVNYKNLVLEFVSDLLVLILFCDQWTISKLQGLVRDCSAIRAPSVGGYCGQTHWRSSFSAQMWSSTHTPHTCFIRGCSY